MAEFKYEVAEVIGTVEKGIELRRVAWNGNPVKNDLRSWYVNGAGAERCGKGVTFTDEEAVKLLNILETIDLD